MQTPCAPLAEKINALHTKTAPATINAMAKVFIA
jgi:hypothetical protein